MSINELPQTDSIEELARFWDSHDLTDFEDDLEEVNDPVFKRETVVKIHLSPEDAEALKRLAEAKGIPFEDLIREWIREKVRPA